MTNLLADAHPPSVSLPATALAVPRLSLSSTKLGWEGLTAQVFNEPREMESWPVPTASHVTLLLFTGGAIHLEQRQAHASWKGGDIHHGEMVLSWGASSAYEVRWWSLSAFPTQTLHLHLNRELLGRMAQEVVGADLARLDLVRLAGFRDPLLAQMAFALWRELEQPAPAGKLYGQIAAQFLALHLVRSYIPRSVSFRAAFSPAPGLADRQLRQVLEFIQAHLHEDLSLDVLAQQVGFSPYHFARLFRRTTGASLHQIVLRQRIERAQCLLEETDLPLAQVASECGFAHQSHLTQVFRQQLGCTPRVYRQEHARCTTFRQNAHEFAR
jgi:AraC family transcriptional regulator